MKRHYLHLVMSLLAGACLAAASCSDSDKEVKAPSPNFPEAVSPTIGAGETFTIEIDPNQDWEASIPTATAAWFWIEDGTQKVWTRLRGDHDHGRTEQGHRHDHARHARTRLHAPHLSAGRVRRLHLQPRRHRKRAYLPLRHRPGRKHRPDVARRPHRIFDAGTRGGQLRMGARQTAGVA